LTSSGTGSPLGGGRDVGDASDRGHNVFTASSSSTLENSTTPFDITYGTGAVEGTVARDRVAVGGLAVADQVFGLTTAVSSDFIDSPFDSLMGVAFSTIAQTDSNTWPENLVQAGALASNLFSVSLGRASTTVPVSGSEQIVTSDSSGSFVFGAIDSSEATSSFVYKPVSVIAYWQALFDGVAVNGNLLEGTSFQGAVDTGTTLVYVPVAVGQALASALGAQSSNPSSSSRASGSYYALPCTQIASLQISLSFGNTLFQFSGQDLNGGRISSSSSYCVLTIVGTSITDPLRNPLAIVGDTWLKNVVAVFEYADQPRIGIASSQNAPATANVTSSSTNSDISNTRSSASSMTAPLSLLVITILVLFAL